MAVTFAISKCPKGYGVYIRAISGNDFEALRDKFPEIDRGLFPVSFSIDTHKLCGALAVNSDRLVRRDTLAKCQRFVNNYCSNPGLIDRLKKLYMTPREKHFEVEKFQYFKLSGTIGGRPIKGQTTQDKQTAQDTLMKFTEFGKPLKLVKSVSRNIKASPDAMKASRERGETTANVPDGMKGMLVPVSKQRHKDNRKTPLEHLPGPRKRTQSLNFWKNK
jgi:hypothetical protein